MLVLSNPNTPASRWKVENENLRTPPASQKTVTNKVEGRDKHLKMSPDLMLTVAHMPALTY